MWSIQTIELELTEGRHDFVIPRREGEEQAIVLVEQVVGRPGDLGAEIQNIPPRQLSRYERVKVFMGDFAEGSRDLTLQVYMKASSFVRITVATLRSGIASAFRKLPCRLCKKLVNLLLTTALALLGVPYMDTSVIFDEDLVSALKGLLDNPSYATFAKLVQEVDLGIWDAILKAAAGIEFVFEFADKLYDKVCQLIGFCPKTA
ncbi:MAG: hypothetical protein ACFCUT_20540 [Kiloniellaceae bacterium]